MSREIDLPDVKLTPIRIDAGRVVHAVRDDLVLGGTKRRAIVPYLRNLQRQGWRHFTYASPFSGYAQVALATACQSLGYECTNFAAPMPSGELHSYSLLAHERGAEVVHCPDLKRASELAGRFSKQRRGVFEIPLGFDDPDFRRVLVQVIRKQSSVIASELGSIPTRVWITVGSGTLIRCFREALSEEVELYGVNVKVLQDEDTRLQRVRALENVRILSTSEEFADSARIEPPIPSNLHYDAKVWAHLEQSAHTGDLWWNVGP